MAAFLPCSRLRKCILIKGLVSAAVLTVAALASARPVPNSFVDHRVTSVSGLIHEIRTDHDVLDRYLRHFTMSEDELCSWIGTLHETRLPQSETFQVYSIPPDGHVKLHIQTIRAGEQVFVDPSDTPVILVRCGNPISLGPVKPIVPVGTPESTPAAPLAPTPPLADVPSPDLVPLAPNTPEALALAPTPMPAPEAPFSLAPTPCSPNYAPLAGLILIGIGIGVTDHHHPSHPVHPVPEPAPFAVLGLGLCGLAFRRRSKKSR
jgi:hypothetical protein